MNGFIKKLIGGLIVLLFVIGLGAFLVFSHTQKIMRESVQFEVTKKRLLQDTSILVELGGVIEINEDVGGRITEDWANLSFEVKGKNRVVIIDSELIRSDNGWEVISLSIRE